ncbi:type II toxin-antitoxin system VapC family toxin [archaeon]|nr:type II toxin-antitoxin system VapC family toxin [archaeon]
MILAFDTSILIEIERKNNLMIDKLKELVKLYPLPAQIPFMSYFEFYNGLSEKNVKNKNKSLLFVKKFKVIQTTDKTAEILSDLKSTCEKKGLSLPLADLMIASQAIENNFVLITLDADFNKIVELKKIVLSFS